MSGGDVATDPLDEPKFKTLGRLLRLPPALSLSTLERDSSFVGGCAATDDTDSFQLFRIDFGTLAFSFSGGRMSAMGITGDGMLGI